MKISYSRRPFNLHENLIFSEIELKNNSKIIKTQKYLNYKLIKSLNRIKKQYEKKLKKIILLKNVVGGKW